MKCSLRSTSARLITQLFRALAERGEITIRLGDLGGLAGFTCFRTGVIHLDPVLSVDELASTLGHELTHLARGPVPAELVAVEEAAVREQTAAMLVPSAVTLRGIGREWTAAELAALAARAGVDRATARDAVEPPTVPLPLTQTLVEVVA